MKKILLIEDRYKRQELFKNELSFDFEQYKNILDNIILDDFYQLANEMIHNSFNLSQYDIIICHKSVQLEENNDSNSIIVTRLKEYCKKEQKTLIFFSGGISANFYDTSEFEYLELNSKTFYSKNLSLFLDAVRSRDDDIMMLCYGEHWKENIVANVLEKVNLFLFDIQNYNINPSDFTIDGNINKVNYQFHTLNEKTLEEIENYKQSLESYFLIEDKQANKNNSLIIHHDNICDFELFDCIEKFNSTNDIDKYISEMLLEIKEKDFEMIFIKDNLSSNYLELLGLRVAYHIRLSSELGIKRYIPIVIVSDFSTEQLCKFDDMANILFTPNVYLCKNTKEEIEKYQQLDVKNLSEEKYNNKFLNKIQVNPPKDTSGTHDIANKWSISRWAEFLNIQKNAVINVNKEEIENTLYFKYLKANYAQKDKQIDISIKKPSKNGKVLLIDDEWDKGWSDILQAALQKDGLEFESFEYEYKDKTLFNLYMQIQKKVKEYNPDVVVLDLRLSKNDHDNEKDIDSFTGIKILEKIHEINAGIQVIMLTATSKSTILEKLYEKKILGYIKKEHPDDNSISTVENINKFVRLVDEGLERKYLIEIYSTTQKVINILDINFTLPKDEIDCKIFHKFNISKKNYIKFAIKIHNEAQYVFDILDSKLDNRFIYALLSIISSFEAINSIFIKEQRYESDRFWDNTNVNSTSLNDKLEELFTKLGCKNTLNIENMIRNRNNYLHSNIQDVHIKPQQLKELFNTKLLMIETIKEYN
ncbi:response regulator [Poseidonibacter antarcticus]|uniref:response regulator n=1 Tax=Poseidonibacter antarcticus TaxID=2478538 RepID=UPI000EF47C9A|nr:response regulator [Poseidonibacter antarcticus]